MVRNRMCMNISLIYTHVRIHACTSPDQVRECALLNVGPIWDRDLRGLKDLHGPHLYKKTTPSLNPIIRFRPYKLNDVQSIQMGAQSIQWSSPFEWVLPPVRITG